MNMTLVNMDAIRIINTDDAVRSKRLTHLDTVVTDLAEIYIEFDYPLNNPVIIKFTNDGGFTVRDFAKAVHKGYTKIYAEEEAAVGDPGHVPGLLNRDRSSGPYGIWGHDLRDLFLEGFTMKSPGLYELIVGS